MRVDIALKNYRCFEDSQPARFEVGIGCSAFLGINNGGKSAVLRFFLEFREMFGNLRNSGIWSPGLTSRNASGGQPQGVQDAHEVFCNLNMRNMVIEFSVQDCSEGAGEAAVPQIVRVEIERGTFHLGLDVVLEGRRVRFENPGAVGLSQDGVLTGADRSIDLRPYLAMWRMLTDTLYIGPFRNAINVGTNERYFDIYVGQAFVQQWREIQTGPTKARNERAMEVVEQIREVFGFRLLQVQASNDNQTLQVFVDGKSYKLPELGAGLSQFLILLINAAVRRPSLLLVDEPELNLHPALQLELMRVLEGYCGTGLVFATHSVGLARAAAERIYMVHRSGMGKSTVEPYESTAHLSEILGSLSYSGAFRELGFTTVLLVEGVTEIKVMQQFLRQRRLEHRVLMVPLGGGAMINGAVESELHEFRRLSSDIRVLIDSERSAEDSPLEPSRQAFVEACVRAGMPIHVLKRRATENYFTQAAIQRAVGPRHLALGEYERLADSPTRWKKASNWRIARETQWEEIASTDLGAFIDSLSS